MNEKDTLFQQFGKVFSKNETIFKENETGEMMFLIRKGRIRIFKTFFQDGDKISGGKTFEKELTVLSHGDFFGEMSLLNQEPRAATAIAIEDTEVLEINRTTFENMIKNNGNFALKIISKLCERVKNTDSIIEELLIHYKQKKIMNKLTELEEKYHEKIPIEMMTSLKDLIQDLTEQEINEILTRLQKYDIISITNNLIKINDVVNLKRIKAFLDV